MGPIAHVIIAHAGGRLQAPQDPRQDRGPADGPQGRDHHHRTVRPRAAAPPVSGCYPYLLPLAARLICLLLHRPVPERGQPHVFRSADAAQQLTAAGINIHVMDALKADGAKAPTAPTKVETTSPAVLMYTSGTTGNPKGVLISHKVPPPAAPPRARGCEPRCPRCA